MRLPLVIVLFLLSPESSYSQSSNFTPPGTIAINDTLYIDKAPVDNIMYAEFTSSVKNLWSYTLQDSLKGRNIKQIDKSLLKKPLNLNESQEIYNEIIKIKNVTSIDDIDIYTYFNHPKYYYNPVVGISKEQAELFCKWRTDMVNLNLSTKLNKDFKFKKVEYRLPAISEFRFATKYFREKRDLLILNEVSPLKINLRNIRKRKKLIFYTVNEFSNSNQIFHDNQPISPPKNTNNDFTFFRCICEIRK